MAIQHAAALWPDTANPQSLLAPAKPTVQRATNLLLSICVTYGN